MPNDFIRGSQTPENTDCQYDHTKPPCRPDHDKSGFSSFSVHFALFRVIVALQLSESPFHWNPGVGIGKSIVSIRFSGKTPDGLRFQLQLFGFRIIKRVETPINQDDLWTLIVQVSCGYSKLIRFRRILYISENKMRVLFENQKCTVKMRIY